MPAALVKYMKSATVFVILNHFSSQILRLVGNLVLTRLLAPELFGVMAFVFSIIVAIHMVSDLGVNQAVIRSHNATNAKFLKVAWSIKAIHGILIGFILIIMGWALKLNQSSFLGSDSALAYSELPYVLMLVSLSPIFKGFSSIRIIDYQRRMLQKEIFILEVVSQVVSLVLMIILAYIFSNIYALAFGAISASIINFIMSYLYLKGVKSGFCFDKIYILEIITFGKWIIVSSSTGFIVNNGDKILLGFWVSASVFGFYSIAQILSHFIKQMVEKVMSSIYFPLFSAEVKSGNAIATIEKIYYSIRFKIDMLCCLSVGFIFSSADSIVAILYDQRYSEVADILKILAFSVVWVGGQLATQLFLAYGKSKIFSHVVTYQAIVFLIITPIFYYMFGFYGVVFSVVVNPIVQYGFTCWYMKKYFFINYLKEIRGLAFIPVGMCFGVLFNYIVTLIFPKFL